MIEGQEGVSWDDWVALARACEENGIESLFRSDHYLSMAEPYRREALDAWTAIAALAARTERLRLGTLVSPVTFRHPALLANAVATVDQVSGGRVELGLGAGWMEAEHRAYGFPFPDMSTRVRMLAEQAEIVHRLWTEERTTFRGEHYALEDCPGLPKPRRKPRILIGGRARRGTADPAARFADEYNTAFADVDECRAVRERLDAACARAGRDPSTLPLSLMTGCVVGSDADEVRERVRRRRERSGSDEEPRAMLIGTVDEVAARLRELEQAGVVRVMLQHLDHRDLDMVALIGGELVPAVS
jgi:F420-dependent oxidoreductase-like protein